MRDGFGAEHVVMYSGGVGSWAAAKRVAEKHGPYNLTLLFTDTLSEHPDTYRFLVESAANVLRRQGALDGIIQLAAGVPREFGPARKAWLERLRQQSVQAIPGLVWLADGRTIWEVFEDVKFLGNTRVDPCSRILKRELADRWLVTNRDPESTTVYVGIDWTEEHRFTRLAQRKLPWVYKAPLCEKPYIDKGELHAWAKREGVPMQALYKMGAPHANCAGGCIKMGQGGFARLLAADPAEYARWEANEEKLRERLGDVSILRDRAGDQTQPLTLYGLRRRIEGNLLPDLFDIGGCGCFVDEDGDLEAA